MQGKQEKAIQNAKFNVDSLLKNHPWIINEKEFFGTAGHRYDFSKMNLVKIKEQAKGVREEIEKSKRTVNQKVDNMFEKVE
jgi:hypothetical protein